MIYLKVLTAFLLTCLGIHVYRKAVLGNLPALQYDRAQRRIANGAGIVLWDILCLYHLHLFFSGLIPPAESIVFLITSLLFAGLGWMDDLRNFNPQTKFACQFMVTMSSFALTQWFCPWQIPFIYMCLAIFYVLWLINAVNFIDILDGLSSLVTMMIISSFAYLFYLSGQSTLFEMNIMWLSMMSAIFIFNAFFHLVFPGDAGAHLYGVFIFFMTLKFLTLSVANIDAWLTVGLLHGYLIFDFLYVCTRRFMKKQSLFMKSPDHLVHWLTEKKIPPYLILTGLSSMQLICCVAACLFYTLHQTG